MSPHKAAPARFCALALLLVISALLVAAAGAPARLAAAAPGRPLLRYGNHEGPITTKYAVMINGNSGNFWPNLSDFEFLFKTLVDVYGYNKDNIFVLWYAGQEHDLDGDGNNDVDYAATRANVLAVFDTLDYARDVDGDDLVLVFTDDHGSRTPGYNEACLNLYPDTYIKASEMDEIFTRLEDQDVVNYWPHILTVLGQCYSGGFLDSMTPYPKRAMCSAASAGEIAHYWPHARPDDEYGSAEYGGFTYYWIAAMAGADPEGNAVDADANDDGHVSFKEAFDYAEAHDEFAVDGQDTPQYTECDAGYGACIALDGTELDALLAIICRGDPNRYKAGGPDVWGGGGGGGCSSSGIKIEWPGGAAGSAGPPGTGSALLSAVVRNPGTEPVSDVLVRFYYGVPATIASAYDTSLHYVGSASRSLLAPGDTALVGPVVCTLPPLNTLGQPYWRIVATMEAAGSPIEGGWVDRDWHVGVENYHAAQSLTGEPMELHYRVRNPEPGPKRVLLALARSGLPEGWQIESTPALGETLEVEANADLDATLTVRPDGVHGPVGLVTVEEELLDHFVPCDGYCDDDVIPTTMTVGGYRMTAGGISFAVTAPWVPTDVVHAGAPAWRVSAGYPNPFGDEVSISYSMPFRSPVSVTIFDVAGRRVWRRDLGTVEAGTHSFTWDGKDTGGRQVPAGTYLVRVRTKEFTADERVVLVR